MVLEIQNLTVTVRGQEGKSIVKDLDLKIEKEKIVALVGGSGSGKSTTGLSILRLVSPALRIQSRKIIFLKKNLLDCSEEEMCRLRGKEMSMIFQEPLEAFNPVFRIGYQIEEVLLYHTDLKPRDRRERVEDLLKMVGVDDPKRIAQSYPHQLSGGLRQRAMIAQAIAAHPQLIIADEPTSNLDVTLQAHMIELFQRLRRELKMAMLLITHDLGMVGHLADEVAVMSAGEIVERGKTADILGSPQHPYTRQLMDAIKV